MTDTMRLLARVANNQAQSSAADLDEVAQKQEENLAHKSKLRAVEKFMDQAMADDVMTFDEIQELHDMRTWVGSTDENFWGSQTVAEFQPDDLGFNPWSYDADKYSGDHGNNSHFYISLSGEGQEAAKIKELFENIESEIEGEKDSVEDDQQEVQFQIQMGTSDLQNAENVRSQAEKRLETQRKDLTRNWAG